MSFFQIIFTILIKPLMIFFEYVYSTALKGIHDPGLSIVALSLAMNLMVLPLYNRADAVQEAENEMELKLSKGVSHIRKTFKGDEKMMMLQTYYRQNGYKPTDVFKGSVSLLLEIPFFIAAYQFLSHLTIIRGVSFGPIADLGAQDALITLGTLSINLLPIIMTTVNLISCAIFTKGYPVKTKVQLYGMALFFFFFLYKSPSGLVFYWTLNNIFSLVKTIYNKSKAARKILNVLFAITGVGIIGALPFVLKISASKSFLLIMLLLSLLCFAPLVIGIIKKKKAEKKEAAEKTSEEKTKEKKSFIKLKPDKILFIVCGLYLTILVGFYIPSNLIQSSPQEFIDFRNFYNPIWFVVSAVCIAFGFFVVWFGVFFSLANEKIKPYFNILLCILCLVGTIDYIFFGKNYVILNSALAYTEDFAFPKTVLLLNLVVVFLASVACFFLVNIFGRKSTILFVAGTVAFFGMSIFNCSVINRNVVELKNNVALNSEEKPTATLSKNGQNVVIIMLDRAINQYIPYFVNEKPELKESFDGFVYYPNTISYGGDTHYGAPALFGGYEYTPEEMNKRDTELMMDKHDEALKVMPAIFSENGFEVTFFDPPYAGYTYIPDLSIFDDYPNVNAYVAKGYFWNEGGGRVSQRNLRNVFCYSLMKASPLALQNNLYNNGMYNENIDLAASDESWEAGVYNKNGVMISDGLNEDLIKDYTTLDNLDKLTEIVDDNNNYVFIMDNELTHDGYYLQEPGYTLSYHVDNTEYEAAHSDRYTVDGETLTMITDTHYAHYQCNMASILLVAQWLDYLKAEGVYDNTRIIVVSDHGRILGHNEKFILDDGSDLYKDTESYNPLLLIKDFNAHGFTTDEQFMSNADVPTISFEGLVENPVNPFTGKPINNDEKYAHPQKILTEHFADELDEFSITKLTDGLWLQVEKDMRDPNNWTVLEDNR